MARLCCRAQSISLPHCSGQFLGTEPGALLAVDLDVLERDMRLTPAVGNPFTSHAAPLQEGRRLAAQGQLAEACLATEAAARVSELCLPEGLRL